MANRQNPGQGKRFGAAPGNKNGTKDDRLATFFAVRPRVGSATGGSARRLKKILPLAAAALLAVLVAWPFLNDQNDSVTLAYSELRARGEQMRWEGARFMGSDDRDRPFEVSADLAVQEGVNADKATLSGVRASIDLGPADKVTVSGGHGVYLRSTDQLTLDGGINLASETGYVISADRATVDLASGVAESNSPVAGSAPFGAFSADGFTLNAKERTLVLEGGVHVRLIPKGGSSTPVATGGDGA